MTTSKDLFLSMVLVTLATAGGIFTIFLQGQIADAQQMSGAITPAAECYKIEYSVHSHLGIRSIFTTT